MHIYLLLLCYDPLTVCSWHAGHQLWRHALWLTLKSLLELLAADPRGYVPPPPTFPPDFVTTRCLFTLPAWMLLDAIDRQLYSPVAFYPTSPSQVQLMYAY